MDKDIQRLIELGAAIGEPVKVDDFGHRNCEWHMECADGNGDGGSAGALLYWTEECGYLNPVGAVLRKVVK